MKRPLLFQIPSTAVPFDGFQSMLVNACMNHATDWKLPADILASMKAKKEEWDAACEITSNRMTASPAAFAARNALLGDYRDLLATVMHYYIAGNEAVSEGDKAALGVHKPMYTRTLQPPPSSCPVLNIDVSGVGAHRIRFGDSETPGSRGRAKSASYCELWYRMSGPPPAIPAEANLRCNITRSGHRVVFDVTDRGKTVYYFARWVNSKGQQGPWSTMYSALIV